MKEAAKDSLRTQTKLGGAEFTRERWLGWTGYTVRAFFDTLTAETKDRSQMVGEDDSHLFRR